MDRLRIAFLTPEYPTADAPDGGLAAYVRKVALGLTDRGHHVTILIGGKRDHSYQDEAVDIHEVATPMGVHVLRLLFGTHSRSATISRPLGLARRLATRFWRLHRERSFDLVQTPTYGALGLFLVGNGRVPVVCRASSYTPMVRAAYGRRRNFTDSVLDHMEIRQLLNADASFAPSVLVADAYARNEGIRPAVIRTPLGAAFPDADNQAIDPRLADTARFLLFFGTLSRIKGIDILAGAASKILRDYPDVMLVMIGRDDGMPDGKSCTQMLRDRCDAAKGRILHIEPLTKTRLKPFIVRAEAVLMPSRVDNYPNACIEAMHCGVPVIGTFGSSIEEIVDHGRTGLLARNEDEDDLERQIRRLLDMRADERANMRSNIEREIMRILAEDRIGQLEAFYSEMLTRFRAQTGGPRG